MTLAVIAACFASTDQVYAFDYGEHAAISRYALVHGCEDFASREARYLQDSARKTRFELLCGETLDLAATCFGHFAAIAGDHIETVEEMVEELSKKDDSEFFVSQLLDCHPFPSPAMLHGTRCKKPEKLATSRLPGPLQGRPILLAEVTKFDCRQTPAGLIHTLKSLGLALHNKNHFSPDSKEQWRILMNTLRAWSDRARTDQEFAALSAFAMHYLEDSFAAGHSGIDRGARYEQDYGNAYHDDFNGTGRFFDRHTVDGDSTWYGYGDAHLVSAPTFYFVPTDLDATNKEQVSEAATQLWRTITGASPDDTYLKGGYKSKEIEGAIALSLSGAYDSGPSKSAHTIAVLSIPFYDGIFQACFYVDNCEKFEAVVTAVSPTGCSDVAQSSHFKLLKCDDETSGPVRDAAKQTAMAMIAYWIGERDLGDDLTKLAEGNFPAEYRTLMAGEADGIRGGINKNAAVLEFDDWESADATPTRRQASTEWGFSVAQSLAAANRNSASELGWNIRSTDLLCGFKRLAPGAQTCDANRVRETGFVNRWSVVDSDGYFFDSLEMAYYFGMHRWGYDVVGLSAKLTAGVDEVWRGGSRRNVYGGGGLSLDLHLGKRVIYLDVDDQWHKVRHQNSFDSVRIMLGFRVMSIDLERARGSADTHH